MGRSGLQRALRNAVVRLVQRSEGGGGVQQAASSSLPQQSFGVTSGARRLLGTRPACGMGESEGKWTRALSGSQARTNAHTQLPTPSDRRPTTPRADTHTHTHAHTCTDVINAGPLGLGGVRGTSRALLGQQSSWAASSLGLAQARGISVQALQPSDQ